MEVQVLSQETLEPNLTHIELRISNTGYLGSYGLHAGKSVPHSEPVRLTATSAEVKVVTPPNGKLELGHLDGWGAGKYGGTTIFMPWTRGNANERFATLVVQGSGAVTVRVGSCRMGWLDLSLSV
jgi:hypothetical protein